MLIINILFFLMLAASIFAFLLRWSGEGYSFGHALAAIVGGIGLVGTSIAALLSVAYLPSWVGAKYKADIINREYGTSYTQAEIFHASSVIDTIQQLHRKRIEVNGNILGKSEEK